MTKAFTDALDAVGSMRTVPQLRRGQLVTHKDCPGEFFTIDTRGWEGSYEGPNEGFRWKIWIRSVDQLAHLPFPALADDLRPVTIN